MHVSLYLKRWTVVIWNLQVHKEAYASLSLTEPNVVVISRSQNNFLNKIKIKKIRLKKHSHCILTDKRFHDNYHVWSKPGSRGQSGWKSPRAFVPNPRWNSASTWKGSEEVRRVWCSPGKELKSGTVEMQRQWRRRWRQKLIGWSVIAIDNLVHYLAKIERAS